MSNSTYDLMLQKKVWKSNGSVSFSVGCNHGISAERLKVGYYPCYGATFETEDIEVPIPGDRTVYSWDLKLDKPGKPDDKVQSHTRAPKPVRKLKLVVKNPEVDVDINEIYKIRALINDEKGPYGGFAPQALMRHDFITSFNGSQQPVGLIFHECATDLLISDEVTINTPHYVSRIGEPVAQQDSASYVVVFYLTHIIYRGAVTMLTEARWTKLGTETRAVDEYSSFYGCC